MSLEELHRRHPRLVYRSFRVDHSGDDLRVGADFELEPGIRFAPEVVIHGVTADVLRSCPPEVLDNLAFHIGLMEIPSYWKAACPPEIVVEAGPLDEAQAAWWKDLLSNGMGEFVFVNGLDWDVVDSVRLIAGERVGQLPVGGVADTEAEGILVPIGGGKDSAVAADLARRNAPRLGAMVLNPTRAALDVARVAGVDQVITATRTIDPELLRLNEAGFLNGHTPFTAYLSFLGVACAVLFGYGAVALSNERSSNEGNTDHLGRTVNHQYSKSWEFERTFRDYSRTHMASGIGSFSLVRPLWELQVARIFAGMDQYRPVFRSCNRGMKTDSWCGRCPKCLFVFALLYPFMDLGELLAVFGRDLFDDPSLIPIAVALVGAGDHKPLECVGTFDESKAAFALDIERARARGPVPPVLSEVQAEVRDASSERFLNGWDEEHAVPPALEAALRSELAVTEPEGAALGTRPPP